jgi:high affinity sulfate transporter 1
MELGSKPPRAGRIARWIPAAGWLRNYESRWLLSDLVGGLTASSVVIPQAMAYAVIASLPLTAGLYTALVPLIVYAVMGTSRVLSVTTTSTIAILTASAVRGVAENGNTDEMLAAAATLAALVGAMLLVTTILRLGVVANFISEPVLTGFKAGIGLVIVVDQIPKVLGVHFDKGHFVHNVVAIADHLPQASVPTLVLALALLALQIGLQRFWPRVPASLCTVVIGIVAFVALGLDRYGIERVGEVRGGLPSFSIPQFSVVTKLWPAAIGIALMSFVKTIAAGRAFRNEDEPPPRPNGELLALSLTNLVGGLFHNMPSGGGTSQTAVNRRAGARTQVAGLATAAMVVAVLLFLAPLIHDMPQAALAAVVIVPCARMIKIREFRDIARVRPMEFSWGLAAFAGVVLVGTLQGILIAVVLSLLALAYHGSRRPVFVLGRKPGTSIFRPQTPEHPEDETFPGLLILKTEGVIHFANAPRVGAMMTRLVDEQQPRVVVIDCGAIPDFEYTALKMLTDAEARLRKSGILLWLAALNPEPLAIIQKSSLGQTLGRPRMHFNLEAAVRAYQERGATDPTGSAAVSCNDEPGKGYDAAAGRKNKPAPAE